MVGDSKMTKPKPYANLQYQMPKKQRDLMAQVATKLKAVKK